MPRLPGPKLKGSRTDAVLKRNFKTMAKAHALSLTLADTPLNPFPDWRAEQLARRQQRDAQDALITTATQQRINSWNPK